MLGGYRDACSQVAKRPSHEAIRLEKGLAAAASRSEDEVCRFLCGILFPIKNCVGEHITHAHASTKERSSIVVEILCCIESDLHDILSGDLSTVLAFDSKFNPLTRRV